jgi:hypothetical protein
MTYLIITERKNGTAMYFRAPVAGQNARSSWVVTKEDATQYGDYWFAQSDLARYVSWVQHSLRQAFAYPRVVDAADIEDDDTCGGTNQGC